MNLILIILLTILFVSLNVIAYMYVSIWERKKRLEAVQENLANFSSLKMEKILQEYEFNSKKITQDTEMTSKINSLIKYQYQSIQNQLKELKKMNRPSKFFKSIFIFGIKYKNVIQKINNYEMEYIQNRFIILDKNVENELEKQIIINLKNELRKVKDLISNSPLDEIRESKKIERKIAKIQSELIDIDKKSENKMYPLSEEFKNDATKIANQIESLENNAIFLKSTFTHIDSELHGVLEEIVSLYSGNKTVLKNLKDEIKSYVNQINVLKKSIKIDAIDLKESHVSKSIVKIDDLVSSLNLIIKSNIDFAKFNKKFYDKVDLLLIDVKNSYELIFNEIRRHGVINEKDRLKAIDHAMLLFDSEVNKFQKEAALKYNGLKPSEISSLIIAVANEYKEYTSVAIKQVKDITNVNKEVNEVNEKIFKLNSKLLKVEYILNDIDGVLKETFEIEKLKLQEQVKKLKELFQTDINKVDLDIYKIIDKLNKKIDNLLKSVEAFSFKIFFIEKSMMILNKYRGLDTVVSNFDLLMESIEKTFKEQKYNDCLRKIKEIIEIHGIKE